MSAAKFPGLLCGAEVSVTPTQQPHIDANVIANAASNPPTAPSIAPKKNIRDLKKLAALIRFIAPYKLRFFCAMLALVVAASSILAIGQGLKHVIDQGFTAASAKTLDQTLFALLGLLMVLGVSTFIRYYLINWVGERFIADIRRAVFDHILKLSPTFFEVTRTGEVISRITNDTALLDAVIGGAFSFALRNIVLFTGGMVMLLITSTKLTLLVVAGIPLVLVPILLLGRRVRKLAREMTDRLADATAFLDETLHEVRTVQAYTHEPIDRARFAERIEAVFAAAIIKARFNAGLIAAVIVLAFGAIGVILWVGGNDVIKGRITGGELSAFLFYSVLVANAVAAVSEVYGELMRASGASERLMELLATTPDIAAPDTPLALPPRSNSNMIGRLSIQNVTFHYPSRKDAPAIRNFSAEISPGQVVALVGPSGAGKTSVFQLLLRFYDAQQGSILIDGVDIRRADPRDVRSRIALVSQDPVIFAASVADNVRYGRHDPDISKADVRAACEAAYALDFIEALPEAFDTYLGERGVRLSGGQRQRISIARAFLADRAILLLDEATSALDAESERMVQLAMQKLMLGRTTLIIAHRLATVKSADRIIVMDQGTIVAEGNHESLVAEGGLYARLAALQFVS